jgi:hypothetical protein
VRLVPQVGNDRGQVSIGNMAIELERHGWPDQALVGTDPFPDRLCKLGIAPFANTGLGIGRDIGRIRLERRFVEQRAAGEPLVEQRLS